MRIIITLLFVIITFFLQIQGQGKSEFEKMNFLIGKWKYNAKSLMQDGTYEDKIFFSEASYIFGGHALKDDFGFKNEKGDFIVYGCTIRSFDTSSRNWKMLWYNYNLSFITEMVGKEVEGEFHFTGKGSDEKGFYLEKITFFNISENKYSWKSDKSYDEGKTWLKNYFSYTAEKIIEF